MPASEFGIYVHWPFCAAKCPYCDFNSHVRHRPVDQSDYARAFVAELNHAAELVPARRVDSVFFGGGTPSLMEPDTVDAILSAIRSLWPVAESVEVTLEANPTSVEGSRFRAYRSLGINRVSLGVQALEDGALRSLGRLHGVKEALAAIDLANDIFDRVSFDLIYGRHRQTLGDWRRELTEALRLQPEHLSLYQLTIESGTPFFDLARAGRLIVPDSELGADFYALTQDLCETAGLPAYEISNHARPGAQSRHNLIYWRSADFIGVGPGAYGRVTTGERRIETTRLAMPEVWRAAVLDHGHGLSTYRCVTREEQADEIVMMGLRLTEGFDMRRYAAVAGRQLDSDTVDTLCDAGYLRRVGGRLKATCAGRPVLNRLIAELTA